MARSRLSSIALPGLALLALLSGGCREEEHAKTGQSAPEPTQAPQRLESEETAPTATLSECKTSHELRKVVDQIEASLRYLKAREEKDDLTPKAMKKSIEAAGDTGVAEADPAFLVDLATFYCKEYDVKNAWELPSSPSDAEACVVAVHAPEPTKEQTSTRELAHTRVRHSFLKTSLLYARRTLYPLQYRQASGQPDTYPQCPSVRVEKDDQGKPRQVDSTVPCLSDTRFEGPLDEMVKTAMKDLGDLEYVARQAREQTLDKDEIEQGLRAIARLKRSAGAVYIAIACDADEAFTFLERAKGLFAPGRGSDLDSKNPVGPVEILSPEERNAPPVQVGI